MDARRRSFRLALLTLVFGVGLDARLTAQDADTLTEAEREVWAQEVKFWETIKAKDVDAHMALYHDDMLALIGIRPRVKRNFQAGRPQQFAERNDGPYTYELERYGVRTWGDTGITYYRARTWWTDVKGNPRTYDSVLTHVYHRTPDGWRLVGGTVKPPPAQPSN